MNQRRIITFATCSGALSVILGAFGAHGLEQLVEKGSITTDNLKTFETAVRYQFYHTIALLLLPAIGAHLNDRFASFAANSFAGGILVFSGSLYLLALSPVFFGQQLSWLGAITPIGGVLFIAGWLFTCFAAVKQRK